MTCNVGWMAIQHAVKPEWHGVRASGNRFKHLTVLSIGQHLQVSRTASLQAIHFALLALNPRVQSAVKARAV